MKKRMIRLILTKAHFPLKASMKSDSKESKDAVFIESFCFHRGTGDESTNESEDPVAHFLVKTRMAVSNLSLHLSHITHAMSQKLTE